MPCPGYQNPEKWLFVDKRGKPVKPVRQTTKDTPSPPSNYSYSSPSDFARDSISISPVPTDYDNEALCLFLVSHTKGGDTIHGDPGHLDFLPSLLANCDPHSCLHKATAAVSLRNLISRKQCLDLSSRATETLIEALTSTNRALADPYLALQDETLAAVYLLSLNESMNPQAVLGSWKGHVQGASHLLRLRGKQQFLTSQGQQLFRLVHTPVLVKSFREGEEPPEESLQMIQLFQRYQVPNHFAGLVSSYFYKVVMLRSKLGKLIQKNVLSIDDIGEHHGQYTRQSIGLLIAQGQALDASSDFSTWAAEDDYWQRRVRYVSSDPADPAASKLSIFYWRSAWVMCQWIRGWTARMYLYITLLRALAHVHDDLSGLDDFTNVAELSHAFEKVLHETVDNVLSSIDFAIGDIDEYGHLAQCNTFLMDPAATAVGPYYIFHALEIIMTSALTTPGQRAIAVKALRRIGRERGFGRLLHWQYEAR